MTNANTTTAPRRGVIAEPDRARLALFDVPGVLRRLGLRPERVAHLPRPDHDYLGQVQRQTHANMTALLDRCLVAALSGAPPQPASATAALEAPARVGMPRGYEFFPRDADVAGFLREHARWAVLALACHAESPAQSRAALEWMRENARLDAAARDAAVNDLIILLQGIDLLLILQSDRDVECVAAAATPALAERDCDALRVSVLRTYRQRHIASGMHRPQFARLLATLISANQAARIRADLASILS